MMCAYYPISKVEVSGFRANHYDILLDIISLGMYSFLIQKAVRLMEIKSSDKILDLGAGTGKNACLMMKYISAKGKLIGLDISEEMISQFKRNCADFPNATIINKRIDLDLAYECYFDKAFVSFVLHGFPQEVRKRIIKNVFKALKTGGEFFILDYGEFLIKELPFYLRFPFKFIECPYAFDFIKRNWEKILSLEGFNHFKKHLFFNGFIRLLRGVKVL